MTNKIILLSIVLVGFILHTQIAVLHNDLKEQIRVEFYNQFNINNLNYDCLVEHIDKR